MSLAGNLQMMERSREAYWSAYPNSSPTKLRWRALAMRHSFHVLPGESILEVGAGTGLWTGQLASVLRGENPITASVFNDDYYRTALLKNLPSTTFVRTTDLAELPAESFDYAIGTAILCHDEYAPHLRSLHRLLKPGGRLLFFEANFWNPQVLAKCAIPLLGRWAGHSACQIGMRKYKLMQAASHAGFTEVLITPYDIVHPLTPARLLSAVNTAGYLLEQMPLVREMCGTLYIQGKKPGDESMRRPKVTLADKKHLEQSTSVVIPCRNEQMNVRPLAEALLRAYEPYLLEIIFVDDSSTDRTASAVRELSREYPCVKLLERMPPNGVGRALRAGYAAARGEFILTMDCDFVEIVPELRDLFDAVAAGYDGAIGSRFSHDSVLLNYPFTKIMCNRAFHLLASLLLGVSVRDATNNLKLYRAEILQSLIIEQPGFAANVETGFKPILTGYRIKQVPISWINRRPDMGSSSFHVGRVAHSYVSALFGLVQTAWRRPKTKSSPAATKC
jgi:dolichol-phosphate mannosyltransferase